MSSKWSLNFNVLTAHLIKHAHVSGSLIVIQAHETERSKTILNLDKDNVLLEQLLGSHADVGAHVEGAAVDEEHHRQKGLVTDVSRFL